MVTARRTIHWHGEEGDEPESREEKSTRSIVLIEFFRKLSDTPDSSSLPRAKRKKKQLYALVIEINKMLRLKSFVA